MEIAVGSAVDSDFEHQTQSPPPKAPEPDITALFSNLDLRPSPDRISKPTPSECLVHLKLLTAFHRLREDIATTDGLFGIHDDMAVSISRAEEGKKHADRLRMLREKRWVVYVVKAVQRFERYWAQLDAKSMLKQSDIKLVRVYGPVQKKPNKFRWSVDTLPPLDVLMILHAFMLNPRNYFEDCIRHRKHNLWIAQFPWAAIDKCIDNITMEYHPSSTAVQGFTNATHLAWDSLEDVTEAVTSCPRCDRDVLCEWTSLSGSKKLNGNEYKGEGCGFADNHFKVQCQGCQFLISHEVMRAQRFRKDVQRLLEDDVPMPGTIIDSDGRETLPPEIIGGTLSDIRSVFESALADNDKLQAIKRSGRLYRPVLEERVAIRRMMSRYWDNNCAFSLDLASAAIRQGSFIEKMYAIDWIHSPAVHSTMEQLIKKYARFFVIIALKKRKMAVPTLDVDLAWHTHQLTPQSYYYFSINKTGRFINHDDKIDETAIADGFQWTSKTYEKLFHEPYSECTCWYCQAVRESHSSKHIDIFHPMKGKALRKQINDLHTDERKDGHVQTAHISAHNAIKVKVAEYRHYARDLELERNYQKACKRAKEAGREPPSKEKYPDTYLYGQPIDVPYYMPYGTDPCISESSIYPADPACATFIKGAPGNCCEGACGGGVAVGACANGACGGGQAGGSCGGPGGCGGSGGGGGCGGGCGGCGGD
ncbi:MAG: hypothetical protein Q9195_006568 [Heterodermia aff. obscurata]